ncbi:unnamed protein product [Soboliphyme baturini]|uniref:BTB domain-containing protein n=1 Tax=Soboliphyme baturini TaxID=241478 RepID=A0A183IG35_9BILA|nr:unnamed protein product [Soboliphyme baturini]
MGCASASRSVKLSIVLLLVELCCDKECAAHVLRSENVIKYILDFTMDKDVSAGFSRLSIYSLHMLRNAARHSGSFCRLLLQHDTAYLLAKSFTNWDTDSRLLVFYIFKYFAKSMDINFAVQLIRSEFVIPMMHSETITNPGSIEATAFNQLLLLMIEHFGDMRIELSKHGAISYLMSCAKALRPAAEKPEYYVSLLSRFCHDAFTRTKMIETGAIDYLIEYVAVTDVVQLQTEIVKSLMCFLYDEQGMAYILRNSHFVPALLNFIQKHVNQFKHLHHCNGNGILQLNNDKDGSAKARPTYCPSSPTYLRCKRMREEIDDTDLPLCKNFLSSNVADAVSSSSSIPSPGSSPLRFETASRSPSVGISSPDSCDSRYGEFFESFSSSFCDKTKDVGACRRLSDASPLSLEGSTVTLVLSENEANSCPSEVISVTGSSSSAQNHPIEPSIFFELERLCGLSIHILSWISHGSHATSLSTSEVWDTLLNVVGNPVDATLQDKTMRMLKRLVRNRLNTDALISAETHAVIFEKLCRPKIACKTKCAFCVRTCQLGCDLLTSLRAQVDTAFGLGIITHLILTGDESKKMMAFRAVPFLMKTKSSLSKCLRDLHGLNNLILKVLSDDAQEQRAAFTSLSVIFTIEQLQDIVKANQNDVKIDEMSDTCRLRLVESEDDRVLFVSSTSSDEFTVDRHVLAEKSDFFRAMLVGEFPESKMQAIKVDKIYSFNVFKYVIHYLYGCRNCTEVSISSAADCLECLGMANQVMCRDLALFVSYNFVTSKYLKSSTLVEFLTTALLYHNRYLVNEAVVSQLPKHTESWFGLTVNREGEIAWVTKSEMDIDRLLSVSGNPHHVPGLDCATVSTMLPKSAPRNANPGEQLCDGNVGCDFDERLQPEKVHALPQMMTRSIDRQQPLDDERDWNFPTVSNTAFWTTLNYLNASFGEDDDDRDYIPQDDQEDENIVRRYETRSRAPSSHDGHAVLFGLDSDFGLDAFVDIDFSEDSPMNADNLEDLNSDYRTVAMDDVKRTSEDEVGLVTPTKVSGGHTNGLYDDITYFAVMNHPNLVQPLKFETADAEVIANPQEAATNGASACLEFSKRQGNVLCSASFESTSASLLSDCNSNVRLTYDEEIQLAVQMRKHVQLLAQLALFGQILPEFDEAANVACSLLYDLKTRCGDGRHVKSFFFSSNLLAAVTVAEKRPPELPRESAAVKQRLGNWVASVVASSSAFPYPQLLPKAAPGQVHVENAQRKRVRFFESEDK